MDANPLYDFKISLLYCWPEIITAAVKKIKAFQGKLIFSMTTSVLLP